MEEVETKGAENEERERWKEKTGEYASIITGGVRREDERTLRDKVYPVHYIEEHKFAYTRHEKCDTFIHIHTCSTCYNINSVVLHSPYILFTSAARAIVVVVIDRNGDGATSRRYRRPSVPDVYKYELSKSDFTSTKNSLSIGACIDKADGSFCECYARAVNKLVARNVFTIVIT